MPTQMNLPILVAEAVEAELARNPDKYRSVTPGPKGDSLTLVSVVTEADFSLTMTFSDGTVYHSPPVRGVQGDDGVQGKRGPRGAGIHHTRWTATTNPEHHFGVAGHMDTYTLYGDEDELVVLGWFSVKNGEDGKDSYDYAVEGGYEGTKEEFYKAIAENATHIEQIRNLISQNEHLFDMVENKGQEFIDQINQIIADFLAMKGAPDGFAELDENGKVPVEQIPDEVRGIIRVNTQAELPISGVPRQLYLVVQDETAEGASTLYHWAEFEYRPATSSTTVLGLTELRELVTALDEASRQELNDARTELEADTLAVKGDLEALTELVGVLGDFRELAFVAHRMHLPVEGEDEVLYIVRSDETNFGDLSIYSWTIDGYRRVSGKMQEAIDQRITALIEDTGADRELFLERLQELADEVASTYATKEELVGASEALNERIDAVTGTMQAQDAALAERISQAETEIESHEQRLTIVEAFREVIGFAHFMHLPDVGDVTKLYIIASDETFGGDLTAYRWSETLGIYTRMYGKAFADIKERLEVTESGKVEGDTFETYVNEVAEILNNYDERLTLLEEKDEVIEVNTRYDLPATGKHGVIYVVRHDSLSNNKATIHIWNGEDYSPIVSSYNTALGDVNSSASEVLATQVWNTTTNDIAAGTPVMLAGNAINEQPAVVPLDLNDPEVLSKFVGIVYKTVSAGKSGVAVRGGVVRNFNTLGGDENWQNGDALYFRGNGSGVISNTIPSIDNYNKPVGYVLEAADNEGILYLVQDPVGNILGGTGLDVSLRQDLANPEKGAGMVAIVGGGTVGQAINYVTPEMCGAAGDGVTDDTAALVAAIGRAKAEGRLLCGRMGAIYRVTDELTFAGIVAFGAGATILSVLPSISIEYNSVVIDGVGTEFYGWRLQGATSGASAYADRTYCGVSVVKSAKRFRLHDNQIFWYKVAGFQSKGIGVTNELPEDGEIYCNTIDGGVGGTMNGGVILGGRNVKVFRNVARNVYNQGFTSSDATRLMPISQYGICQDVWIDDNSVYFADPPADVAQTAADAGIKVGGGPGNKARGNTIRYVGSKTGPAVEIGKGIEVKMTDLAQQRDRNNGTTGTGEGVYLPHNELTLVPEVAGNTVLGMSVGIFSNGVYAPSISENTLVVTQKGIILRSQGATIQGVTYTLPAIDGAGVMRADMDNNTIVSLDDREVGSGNAFVGIDYGTNYNRAIGTKFRGKIAAKHGGTNQGVQNYRRDADGREYGASMFASGDLLNYVDVAQGNASQVVSGSLQQGGSSKLNLVFEGTVTDYMVDVQPQWNTTWWISAKSATSFTVSFGTAAPLGGGRIYWKITPKAAWIS